MEVVTKNSAQTQRIGREIGYYLKENLNFDKKSQVVALSGVLGSGKTVFVQGLAYGLGVREQITSPTFTIIKSYVVEPKGVLHHVDLYRLEGNIQYEVDNLGIVNLWQNPGSIVAIEWSEKIFEILPKDKILVVLEVIDIAKRKLIIKGVDL